MKTKKTTTTKAAEPSAYKKRLKVNAREPSAYKKRLKVMHAKRRHARRLDPIWRRVVSDVVAAFIVEGERGRVWGASGMRVTNEKALEISVKREARRLCAKLKKNKWPPCITPGCRCRWSMLADVIAKKVAESQQVPVKAARLATNVIVHRFLSETSEVN